MLEGKISLQISDNEKAKRWRNNHMPDFESCTDKIKT